MVYKLTTLDSQSHKRIRPQETKHLPHPFFWNTVSLHPYCNIRKISNPFDERFEHNRPLLNSSPVSYHDAIRMGFPVICPKNAIVQETCRPLHKRNSKAFLKWNLDYLSLHEGVHRPENEYLNLGQILQGPALLGTK
jgi:hypothetical protein